MLEIHQCTCELDHETPSRTRTSPLGNVAAVFRSRFIVATGISAFPESLKPAVGRLSGFSDLGFRV